MACDTLVPSLTQEKYKIAPSPPIPVIFAKTLGGISYFSCVREGTRVSHAKFQVSMSIRSLTVVFYKNLGVGGGGGALLSIRQ